MGDPEDIAVQNKAADKYVEAARSFNLIGTNVELKAEGYAKVAEALGQVGRKELARQYYDESAAIYLKLGKKLEAITALVGSQGFTTSTLDYISVNERIHQTALELGDERYEFGSLIQLGTGYFQLGDFTRISRSRIVR